MGLAAPYQKIRRPGVVARVLEHEVLPANTREVRPGVRDELLPSLRRERRDVDAVVEEVEILDHHVDPDGTPGANGHLPGQELVEDEREQGDPDALDRKERREHVPELVDLLRRQALEHELEVLRARLRPRMSFLFPF